MRFCRFLVVICAVLAASQAGADEVPLRPAWILQLPDTVDSVLVADAGGGTLHRFVRDGDAIRWNSAYYMSIGQNGVRKERAWDKKTPLGAYFINEELDTAPLHEKYGTRAFPIDYPNDWDRRRQRTGYGIWLHGVDRRHPKRPPRDTDGCLALPNAALESLAGELRPGTTPILVAAKIEWLDADEIARTRHTLLAALERWRSSQVAGDMPGYLSLYGEAFEQDGLSRSEWAQYRSQIIDGGDIESLDIDTVYLLADPAEDNLYLSRFRQTTRTASGPITFTKRLYWRRTHGGDWEIVAEATG